VHLVASYISPIEYNLFDLHYLIGIQKHFELNLGEFEFNSIQFKNLNSIQVACNVINIFIHISTTSIFSHHFIVTDNVQHVKPKSSILRSSPILNMKCANLIGKKNVWKKNCPPQIFNHLSLLKYHPFASNFEHWNFTSDGAYLRKYMLVQILCSPYDFWRYSIIILSNVNPIMSNS